MFIDDRLGTLHEPLSGRRIDGSEALRLAALRATTLRRHGVHSGARVFLHCGNRAEFFIDLLATWLLGGCVVPVDVRFTAYEVSALAEALQPTVSVWEEAPGAEIAAALSAASVPVLGIDDAAVAADEDLLAAGLPSLDEDALILLTSGTTGRPKGVVQTHRALRARWNHQRERLGVGAFAQTLCMVPIQFAWGLVGHALYAWFSGQTVHLLPAFRPDVLMRLGALCDELGITCLPSVPSMWRLALKTVAPPRRNTLRLVTLGTAPVPPGVWKGVKDWSGGAETLNIYGISETGWIAGGALDDTAGDEVPVGEPWGVVARVLDSDRLDGGAQPARACAPGETGHLWIQSASLMRGYFGRDDLTAQVVTRGWFCTGDLAALDERGRIVLRGRAKDLINVGGAKIYPQDVDAALAGLPGVEDAAAFAVEDALLGENIGVAVVLSDPTAQTLPAVYRALSHRLAAHQLPRRWHVVGEIPRTARGKVSRAEVARFCTGVPAVEQRVLERQARAEGER